MDESERSVKKENEDRNKDKKEKEDRSKDKKAKAEEEDEGGEFLCSICGLKEKFHYYGKKPPFAKQYTFQEDVFVSKDPFSPLNQKNSFILFGSKCCQCQRVLCQSQDCSLFYTKRFCWACAFYNIDEFPEEIKQEILKRQ